MADDRKNKERVLLEAIKMSILMSDEEKSFWTGNIPTLPDSILDEVLKAVNGSNKTVESYITAAIESDPDINYLAEIKTKVNKARKKAVAIDEEESKKDLDEDLEKQIQNL